jgi:hypothetical protein
MVMAVVVLVSSAGLFMFYLQACCERVLRRAFKQNYSDAVAKAMRLEFPGCCERLKQQSQEVDYAGLESALRADFHALTYLLKGTKSPSLKQGFQERLLQGHFLCLLFTLRLQATRDLAGKSVALKLGRILDYFSNELGRRLVESGRASFVPASGSINN